MKNVLFIANKLHGYEQEIVTEFQKQEYNIFFVETNYSLFQLIIFKILTFLHLKELLISYKNHIFNKKLSQKQIPDSIDILFCIANNSIDPYMLENLYKIENIKTSIMYIWDNREKLYYVNNYLETFDNVSTFDEEDSKTLNIPYRPTFYSSELQKDLPCKYDFFFIGNYTPKRKDELDNLLVEIDQNKCFLYLYENFWMALVKKYIKRIPNYMLKDIKFKSIDRQTYNSLVSQSEVIMEISNSNQRGVTQRALDALYLGKKLITNINTIQNYDFFHKNNILIYDNNTTSSEIQIFLDTPSKIINDRIVFYYSREKWLIDILEINIS